MSAYILHCVDCIRRLHPYTGVIILSDVNSIHDGPVQDYSLKQIVTRAARGKSILDKIFTIPDRFAEPTVMPAIALSDHCAIVLSPKALKAVGSSRRINVTSVLFIWQPERLDSNYRD